MTIININLGKLANFNVSYLSNIHKNTIANNCSYYWPPCQSKPNVERGLNTTHFEQLRMINDFYGTFYIYLTEKV